MPLRENFGTATVHRFCSALKFHPHRIYVRPFSPLLFLGAYQGLSARLEGGPQPLQQLQRSFLAINFGLNRLPLFFF